MNLRLRCSCFLLLAVPPAAAGQPLTVIDDGFESSWQAWTRSGVAQFAVDAHQAHSGRSAARIDVPSNAELHFQQIYRTWGPVAFGDQFRATVWVHSEGVHDGSGAYAAMQFVDTTGKRIAIFHSEVARDNGARGWQKLTIAGKTPRGATRLRLDLILHAHGVAWFDDVEVVRVARLEPWPDLGDAVRRIDIDASDVVHPDFAGVGFHVFHHLHSLSQEQLDTVVTKRWRELRPSFARMTDKWDWDQATLDRVATFIRRFQQTGTIVYLTTWGPKKVSPGAEMEAYARRVVDNLEHLVRDRGCTNIRYYCMSNELSLDGWGSMYRDLPLFERYHRALFAELRRRRLDVGLLATDASPLQRWDSLRWAAEQMDDVTAIYGGHHYINNHTLDDERFYPWFFQRVRDAVQIARLRGKNFLLGEFGCKQDGRVVDGVKNDACIYWDTPQEPYVTIQLADAVIASINAGAYAMGYWTFMDFPDDYRSTYRNKWGLFRWSGDDFSTRAPYYGYALLTRYFRGPAATLRVKCGDPWLRVAAARLRSNGAWSIAVLNRYRGVAPVDLRLRGARLNAVFRKYVYDPRHVDHQPFGDLPGPDGRVTMKESRLSDTIAAGCLVVYTTDFEDTPPAAVRGLKMARDSQRVRLTWQPVRAPDLCYYRVYRLTPQRRQIGSTVATHFVDHDGGPATAYHVVAVDNSGNAGP